MRFTATSAALLATFASSASAIITGVIAPDTVYANQQFEVILTTSNYIQGVTDVAVAVGVIDPPGIPGTLGRVAGSFYLGPSQSNILTNITLPITLPQGTSNGYNILSAQVYSLYGTGSTGALTDFNTTVNVVGF